MKESYIAAVGCDFKERELEDTLAAANHDFDYTIKVVRAGVEGEALFGKIVRDSYAENNRDPQVTADVLAVGGYDLELLHHMATTIADGRYDPHDRDSDQRVVRMIFSDFGIDCFNLLSRYMPFSVAFYDIQNRELVAGRGRAVRAAANYGDLFYAKFDGGGIAFSNDEDLLATFSNEVIPVPASTYYKDGEFTTYREESFARSDEEGIRANYSNARSVIELVNALLAQAADDTLKLTISRLFDEYFESLDPRQRIERFVAENLEDEMSERIAATISKRIDELGLAAHVDSQLEERYRALLDSFVKKNATPTYNIVKLDEVELATAGPAYFHEKFEQVLTQVQLDEPVMLIGPAGSGKNYAVSQIAEGLGLSMYYTNNASNEFKLTGFIDAGGTYRDTQFYKAFKNGGVFFLDEIDNSDPSALIVINSALANGYMAFPHETISCHPDFRCVAAANTWGSGSNLQYVGRNVLDGATLDRFDMVFFDYDRRLERALYPSQDLLEFMWAFRDAVDASRIPHIVSTRAIGKCYKKERYGMDLETILRTNVIRGLAQDDLNIAIGAMKDVSEENPYLKVLKTLRVER